MRLICGIRLPWPLALAGLLVLSGCGSTAPPRTPMKPVRIGLDRVAVVEFSNRSAYSRPAREFARMLSEKLARRTVATDVIVIPRSGVQGLDDPFTEGRVPVKTLARIRERYLAEAIVIGSVEDYNPYWKPWVHVTLKVVDTATGEIPYQVSERWDAGQQQAKGEIEAYYEANYHSEDCRFGPDLFVVSPHYFLRFVADRIAAQMVAAL